MKRIDKVLPFVALPHKTTALSLGDSVQSVTLTDTADVGSVLIDNSSGSTAVLVEFWDNPLDADSQRIPPYAVMILSIPWRAGQAPFVRVKRPSGSADETIYITQGNGF